MNKIIYPTTISLLTTFNCTAQCKNCCFQCSPSNKLRMSLDEMKFYVDKLVNEYPSIKVVVFSGGECFTLKKDLEYIIKYVSNKGLLTRVVTNGYWATSYEKAKEILCRLKEGGLKEVNFSTGDEHQEWVPYDNIVYGCLASRDLGLNTLVNVETHPKAFFRKKVFEEDGRINCFIGNEVLNANQIKISQGIWIPFSEKTKEKINCIEEHKKIRVYKTCDSLFHTIAISPEGNLLSCCGLSSLHNNYLKIGNIKDESILKNIELQFNDFLKIWLYTEGPIKILEFLYKDDLEKMKSIDYSRHICDVCKEICSNKGYLDVIKRNILFLFTNVIMKYNLKYRELEKINN
ncbi:MAG: radical SAM protein [Parabacteroides sp.]|nr:radical SAM protein [Parabacteroides sp.]